MRTKNLYLTIVLPIVLAVLVGAGVVVAIIMHKKGRI
jgi:ABC-type transport system involved in cytochrome bd biosynthesis fused ATPase/permease subunit